MSGKTGANDKHMKNEDAVQTIKMKIGQWIYTKKLKYYIRVMCELPYLLGQVSC